MFPKLSEPQTLLPLLPLPNFNSERSPVFNSLRLNTLATATGLCPRLRMSVNALSFVPSGGGGVQPNPPIGNLVNLTDNGAYRIVKSNVLLSKALKSQLVELANGLGIDGDGTVKDLQHRIRTYIDENRFVFAGFSEPKPSYRVEFNETNETKRCCLSELDVGRLRFVASFLGISDSGTKGILLTSVKAKLESFPPHAFPLFGGFDPGNFVANVQLQKCTYRFKIRDVFAGNDTPASPEKKLSEASMEELVQIAKIVNVDLRGLNKDVALNMVQHHLRSFLVRDIPFLGQEGYNAAPFTFPTGPMRINPENNSPCPRRCQFPECPNYCQGCCSYCFDNPSHQKCEALLRYGNLFSEESEFDLFGKNLAQILNDDFIACKANGNPLQPSAASLEVIKQFSQHWQYSTDTLDQLYEKMNKYLPMLLLFIAESSSVRCDKKNPRALPDLSDDRKVLNQRERAKKFAECLIRNRTNSDENHKKLVVFDGHGAMVLLILECLYLQHGTATGKRLLKDLKLLWVDMNKDVNLWHDMIFRCGALECVAKNIFDLSFSRTDLIYFNFCGVTESFERLMDFLHSMKVPICMVSFSIGRASKDKNFDKLFLELFVKTPSLGRVLPVGFSSAASRSDFSTFVVEKFNSR